MLALHSRSGTALAKLARQIHCGGCVSALYNSPPSTLQQKTHKLAREELREHYERNAATTRPIAPHLLIYKMESHMFQSLLLRATGPYLAIGTIGVGALSLAIPDWFTQASLLLSSVHPFFTTFVKFGIAMPFAIHASNGVKYLIHDFGHLLGRSQITSTQVVTFIVALTVGTALSLYTIK